jgi:hypothetical protein
VSDHGSPDSNENHLPVAFFDNGDDQVTFCGKNSVPRQALASSSIQFFPLTAFEDEIQVSYVLSRLFAGGAEILPLLMSSYSNDTLQQHTGVKALSKMYFGRMHKHPRVMIEGARNYCMALRSLKRDLQDPHRCSCLEVLSSSMVLSTYEVSAFLCNPFLFRMAGTDKMKFFASSSPFGWVQHALGIGRIIELRGPTRHQSPLERIILESVRTEISLACLVSRKRCFLSRPDWKSIPWALEPESKSAMICLQDILMEIPEIAMDFHELTRATHQGPEKQETYFRDRERFSHRVSCTLNQLYDWRITWEACNPDAVFEVPVSDQERIRQHPTFKSHLFYKSLSSASEITLYNTILCLICRLGHSVMGRQFSTQMTTVMTESTSESLHLPFSMTKI